MAGPILFVAADPRECAGLIAHWDNVRAVPLPVTWVRTGRWKGKEAMAIANGAGADRAFAAVLVAPAANEATAQVGGPVLWVLVFLSGVYGGYFGAAQGVLLIGLMGVVFTDTMQRINAVKNVLAGLVNGVAALVFIVATHIDWGAAGLIACGAILGGQVGARIGRKLPPLGLRVLIICVGVVALVKLLA